MVRLACVFSGKIYNFARIRQQGLLRPFKAESPLEAKLFLQDHSQIHM